MYLPLLLWPLGFFLLAVLSACQSLPESLSTAQDTVQISIVSMQSSPQKHVALSIIRGDREVQLFNALERYRYWGNGQVVLDNSPTLTTLQQQAVDALPLPPKTFVLYTLSKESEWEKQFPTLIERIQAEVKKRDSASIQLIGHIDAQGNTQKNEQLVQALALQIREILLEQGFPRQLISVVSRGASEPAIHAVNSVREPLNQRIEIKIR